MRDGWHLCGLDATLSGKIARPIAYLVELDKQRLSSDGPIGSQPGAVAT